jgi:hypothetical protein
MKKIISHKFFVIIFTGVLAILMAHNSVIANQFATMPGDRYDVVIMSAILELELALYFWQYLAWLVLPIFNKQTA